ncbi:MAG TPA: twin-arginine translocation signal domain-containing protein [Kamptonema sp.]|nr:twin-arginine translocation signal domain-containing protein [Kamptonema sp.]
MSQPNNSTLNRRHFLSFVALGTVSLLTKDLLC